MSRPYRAEFGAIFQEGKVDEIIRDLTEACDAAEADHADDVAEAEERDGLALALRDMAPEVTVCTFQVRAILAALAGSSPTQEGAESRPGDGDA